jgi:short-subunit dehydrogenase
MAQLAMVTGASSGIGEAFAERLAGDGWDLVLVARRRERLEAIAARVTDAHGVSARVVEADLSDPAQLATLCAEAASLPLALLVNNAALAHYMPFATLPPESAQELVQLNVLAPVLLTRSVLDGMVERGEGAVINVASLLAFSGSWEKDYLPKRAVYAATKSFLTTFTQIIAAELRDTGVRAQVVCPGLVRSEFHTRQGVDMSAVPRMEPESVVQASLSDLARGVVVSIPGAEDASALREIDAASDTLLSATRTVELPARYAGDTRAG